MNCISRKETGDPESYFLQKQQREIGFQIFDWSCAHAALEYLTYFKMCNKRPLLLQEDIALSSNWAWDKIIPAFHMRPEDSPNDVINPKKLTSKALTGRLNTILEKHPNETAFFIMTKDFMNEKGLKHTLAIDYLNENYCRLIIPKSNLPKVPEWGDFTWEKIVSWDSTVYCLRKV